MENNLGHISDLGIFKASLLAELLIALWTLTPPPSCPPCQVPVVCSLDDVHISVATLDGVITNGPGILLHAQSLGLPQGIGVQTTPLQTAQLILVAGVVVHRELLHGHQSPVSTLQKKQGECEIALMMSNLSQLARILAS